MDDISELEPSLTDIVLNVSPETAINNLSDNDNDNNSTKVLDDSTSDRVSLLSESETEDRETAGDKMTNGVGSNDSNDVTPTHSECTTEYPTVAQSPSDVPRSPSDVPQSPSDVAPSASDGAQSPSVEKSNDVEHSEGICDTDKEPTVAEEEKEEEEPAAEEESQEEEVEEEVDEVEEEVEDEVEEETEEEATVEQSEEENKKNEEEPIQLSEDETPDNDGGCETQDKIDSNQATYSSDESDVGESQLLSGPLDDSDDDDNNDGTGDAGGTLSASDREKSPTPMAIAPTTSDTEPDADTEADAGAEKQTGDPPAASSVTVSPAASGTSSPTPARAMSPITFSLEPDDDLLPDTSISNLTDIISDSMSSEPAIPDTALSFPNLSSIVAKPAASPANQQQLFQTTTVINLTQAYRKVRRPTILKKTTTPSDPEIHKPTQVIFIGPANEEANKNKTPVSTAQPVAITPQPAATPVSVPAATSPVVASPAAAAPTTQSITVSPEPMVINDPDESNVITIAPKDIDSDDDECCIIDPEVARRIPPPTPPTSADSSLPPLRIQSVQSLNPNSQSVHLASIIQAEEPELSSSRSGLPVNFGVGGNQPVVNVELKNQNTIFGLMMILRTDQGTEREFFCNFCLTKSTEEKLFMDHVASHLFVCGLCPYQSFARVDVVRHILKIHPDSQTNLAKLHTMHLENVTLKPQGQSLALSSSSTNSKSWSNVLGGNNLVAGGTRPNAPTVSTAVSTPQVIKRTIIPPKKVNKLPTLVPASSKAISTITNLATIAPRIAPKASGVSMSTLLPSLHTNPARVTTTMLSTNPLTTVVAALPNSVLTPGSSVLVRPAGIPTPVATVGILSQPQPPVPPPPTSKPPIPSTVAAIVGTAQGRRLGINVLEKSAQPTEDIFYISMPTQKTSTDKSIVVNGKSHRVVMYQCGKCQFRDQDDQVVRMHQKAHMFSKLTIILSAYGVVCPHCLIVHRTIPFMYEHLELIHKSKPPTFFLMMRCMGANDMYWFCPCCNVVKSEKQKHVVWQHTLTGHDGDRKFFVLKHKIHSKQSGEQYAEKFLVDLWVNGFVLNTVTTCTAVVPKGDSVMLTSADKSPLAAEKPSATETLPGAPADPPLTPPVSVDSDKESMKLIPSVPNIKDKGSLMKNLLLTGMSMLQATDMRFGLPSKEWLTKNHAGCTVKQTMSKTYGKIITIDSINIPKNSVLVNYKNYYRMLDDDVPECRLCGKTFTSSKEDRKRPLNHVEEHVFAHFDIRVWVCPYCLKTFKRRVEVVSHSQAQHVKLPNIVIHMNPYVPEDTVERKRLNKDDSKPEGKAKTVLCQQEYVYACFHCIRQVSSMRQMWSHMRYVHPEKPFSRSMFQKYHLFEPDYDAEVRKIETGERRASVCVVRVEDMEEYEGLRALLSPTTASQKIEDTTEEKTEKFIIPRKLPPSKEDGKYECHTCGYRSLKLETTRLHMLQKHPGEELAIRDHAAVLSFGSNKNRMKGRMLYLCPSCTFFSNKREALLVHAGRNPSHFSHIQSGLDLEEAKQLAEKQTGHNLRERSIKPEIEEELELPRRRTRSKPPKRPAAAAEKVSPYLVPKKLLNMDDLPSIGSTSDEPPTKKRVTARKSTAMPAMELSKPLIIAEKNGAVVTQTMAQLRCALCITNYESNITFMKYHFAQDHHGCAIVAINDVQDSKLYICPVPSCTFFDEYPALIENHLILSHDGDPNKLRHLYTDSAIAAQQILHVDASNKAAKKAAKGTDVENSVSKKPNANGAAQDEGSDTVSLADPEYLADTDEEKGKPESSCDQEEVDTSIAEEGVDLDGLNLNKNSSTEENSSDDKDVDPDYDLDQTDSLPKPVKKKRKKKQNRSLFQNKPYPQKPMDLAEFLVVPKKPIYRSSDKSANSPQTQRYSCRHCADSWSTDDKWQARAHLIKNHETQTQEVRDNKKARQRQRSTLFFCCKQKCYYSTYDGLECAAHDCTSSDMELKCKQCSFVTDDVDILNNHIKVHKKGKRKRGLLLYSDSESESEVERISSDCGQNSSRSLSPAAILSQVGALTTSPTPPQTADDSQDASDTSQVYMDYAVWNTNDIVNNAVQFGQKSLNFILSCDNTLCTLWYNSIVNSLDLQLGHSWHVYWPQS